MCVCLCVLVCVCDITYTHARIIFTQRHTCMYIYNAVQGRESDGRSVRDQGEEEEWDYHWDPTREAEEDMLQAKFVKFL